MRLYRTAVPENHAPWLLRYQLRDITRGSKVGDCFIKVDIFVEYGCATSAGPPLYSARSRSRMPAGRVVHMHTERGSQLNGDLHLCVTFLNFFFFRRNILYKHTALPTRPRKS